LSNAGVAGTQQSTPTVRNLGSPGKVHHPVKLPLSHSVQAIIHRVDDDAIRRMESDRAENHEVSGKNLIELVAN